MNSERLLRKAYKARIKFSDLIRRPVGYDDSVSLDIVIPCIEKDARTLPYVIDGIRKYVKNKVGKVYIVSPPSALLRDLARNLSCVNVDEREVIPFDPTQFYYAVEGWNRKGWILQQLIKLNADTALGLNRILIVDADTVFVSPQHFYRNGQTVFSISDEYHEPYYRTFAKLLGTEIKPKASFVSHHIVMESEVLQELRKKIETFSHCAWHEAILKNLDPNELSCFSEYETYSNFFWLTRKEKMAVEYYWNRSMEQSNEMDKVLKTLSYSRLKSVSFHAYVRNP